MSGKLALVTGASGFIAGHVIDQLLKKGYRVRGTARGAKAESLSKTINVPGLEFAQVDDLAKSDISEVLKGVDVILHVASPLPGAASVDVMLNSAIEGTLNVLRQAERAGIEKVVVTSSCVTILDPDYKRVFSGENLTESDWGKVTVEEAHAHAEEQGFVYSASKILAEKAAWDFAKKHPKLDIATILPTFVYGPYPPNFPPSSKNNLSTNAIPYELIKGNVPGFSIPTVVDVRDVAKAHILALDLPRAAVAEDKRFIVNYGLYSWRQGAEHLKKTHPEIKTIDIASLADIPPNISTIDATRSREVLKLEYTSPDKMLDDFVESIAEVEKIWSSGV
ncbi:hypothetical protein BDQ17DRAFT_752668 [Cyathus striatus]|nr:hypothetical protein BDQ17DRAFT_752668 [Cyathus striatus]